MNTPSTSTNILATDDTFFSIPDLHHAAQLEAFFTRSMATNFAYFPGKAREFYRQNWTLDAIEKRIKQPNSLLGCAFTNDQISGLIWGTLPEGGVATIIWLMVAAEYQNRGIGAALLGYAKKYYKTIGAHKIKLTVHDKKARQFYLREGFKQEALHERHWWEMDFYAMAYDL